MNFQTMSRTELIAHIEKEAKAFTPPGVLPIEAAADVMGRYAVLTEAAAKMQLEYIQHLFKHRWRPMSEAPMDGTWVLVKIGRDYIPEQACDVLRFKHGMWRDAHGGPGCTDRALAAWQPLPEPPTGEEMEALKNG